MELIILSNCSGSKSVGVPRNCPMPKSFRFSKLEKIFLESPPYEDPYIRFQVSILSE